MKYLKYLGVFLIILGNFLPWRCLRGFATMCEQGIDLYPIPFQPRWIPLVVLVSLMLFALVLNGTFRIKPFVLWIIFSGLIFLGLVYFLIIQSYMTFGTFHQLIVGLCFLTTWLVFTSAPYKIRVGKLLIGSNICLIITITIALIQLIMQLPQGSVIDEEVTLEAGLLIVETGAMVLLFALYKSRESFVYS